MPSKSKGVRAPVKPSHTPGPWSASGHAVLTSTEGLMAALKAGRSFTCRKVAVAEFGHYVGFDEAKANALLIAAAPDLLKAAKLAVENFRRTNASDVNFLGDDDHEVWVALDAAIAKAERGGA